MRRAREKAALHRVLITPLPLRVQKRSAADLLRRHPPVSPPAHGPNRANCPPAAPRPPAPASGAARHVAGSTSPRNGTGGHFIAKSNRSSSGPTDQHMYFRPRSGRILQVLRVGTLPTRTGVHRRTITEVRRKVVEWAARDDSHAASSAVLRRDRVLRRLLNSGPVDEEPIRVRGRARFRPGLRIAPPAHIRRRNRVGGLRKAAAG